MLKFAIALIATAAIGGIGGIAAARPAADGPVEIGTVDWGRDLDAALARSKKTGKPVFLLFQEVPG